MTRFQDVRGLELTTASEEAARKYDDAVADYLQYRTSAAGHLKAALASDPDFAMAHCLKGYFMLLIGTLQTRPAAAKALNAADAVRDTLTWREQQHVSALAAWLDGRTVAADGIWRDILVAHPRDLLALRLQHFNAFWMGRSTFLRDVPAGVMGEWDESLPGYGNVLGMLSFGMEENGDYGPAERLGRQAVEIDSDDLWAVHAVAHVYEMQGRLDDGLAWLDQPPGTWSDRNPFKDHLWWHTALFPLEKGDYERVLELYDAEIRPDESGFYLDVQNAVSMLLRLELLGVDVGDRWDWLADISRERIGDHVLAFTDLHFVMALAAAGRFEAAEREVASLADYADDGADDGARLSGTVAVDLAKAILAYYRHHYHKALALLQESRPEWIRVGASHAQRDIFKLLAIASALGAGEADTARHLLCERVTLRPNSYGNWLAYAEILEDQGNEAEAEAARAHAGAIAG